MNRSRVASRPAIDEAAVLQPQEGEERFTSQQVQAAPRIYAALQQSIGNQAVGRLIESRGERIEPRTRLSLEHALSSDLSGVRVHGDAAAAEATSRLGASALNAGQDIFLSPEAAGPDTPRGRSALAHEAVHVAQRARFGTRAAPAGVSTTSSPAEAEADALGSTIEVGGAVPDVSMAADSNLHRQDEAEQRRREQTDRLAATMAALERQGLAGISTSILIERARVLQDDLDHPEDQAGPRQRVESARTLLAIRRVLQNRIESPQPATPYTVESQALPESVDALDQQEPFRHVADWQAVVDLAPVAEPSSAPAPRGGGSRSQTAEPATQPAEEAPEPATEPPAEAAQPETAAAVGGTSGMPEVSAGLNTAAGLTFRDIARVVAGMVGGDQSDAASDVETATAFEPSLLSRTSRVLYLGTRFYILDRSGAIVHAIDPGVNVGHEEYSLGRLGGPEQFSMEPSWLGAEPGTYFLCSPRNRRGSGMVAARLDGGVSIGRETIVDFMPRGFRDLIGINSLIESDLRAGNGVLVIVSQGTRGPNGETGDIPMDANFGNVGTALDRVRDTYLMPALEREIARRINNPWRSLAGEAFNFGWGWVQNRFPLLELVTTAFEIMERAAWAGRVLSIICYARARDEIDLGAQAIAERAAQETIAFIASRLSNATAGVAGAAGRAARDRHNGDRAAAGDETAPVPEGENGPFVPEPAAETPPEAGARQEQATPSAEPTGPVQLEQPSPEQLAQLRQQWEQDDQAAAARDLQARAAPEAAEGTARQQQQTGTQQAAGPRRQGRPPQSPDAVNDDAQAQDTAVAESDQPQAPPQGRAQATPPRQQIPIAEATPVEVMAAARRRRNSVRTPGPNLHAWNWYRIQAQNAGREAMSQQQWLQLGPSERPIPPVAFSAGPVYYVDTYAFLDALSPDAAAEFREMLGFQPESEAAAPRPANPAATDPDTDPGIAISGLARPDRRTQVDLEAQQAGREQRAPDEGDPNAEATVRRGVARLYDPEVLRQHLERAFSGRVDLSAESLRIQPSGQFEAEYRTRSGGEDAPSDLAGYVDPRTGQIYIRASARESFVLRFHEGVHAVSIARGHRNNFLDNFGQFLEEAVTETIALREVGPELGRSGYQRNVDFLAEMQTTLQIDPRLVERAYMEGAVGELNAALERAFGGGPEGQRRRGEFQRAMYRAGPRGEAAALTQARRLMSEAPVVVRQDVPVGTPGEGAAE